MQTTYSRAGVRLETRSQVARSLRTVAFYLPLVLFVLVTFAPIYWIILSAFTPITDLFTVPLNYIPLHPGLINFQNVAQAVPLGQQTFNSAFLAFFSALFSVVFCLLAAYAFARIKFPGSNVLLIALLLSGFLPGIATIIPLFQLFESFNLVDSLQGLLILIVSGLLPTTVWILTSFIRQIPFEMEEAAQVDGAGFPTILWRVVVPVLRPALATIFLINLITAWDEFFLPLIFSRSANTATLTLGITQAAIDPQHQQVAWGTEAAMGLLVIIPVFFLAMVFQKQIVEGLMAGALKG
jgi:ABC-type glycerol-3-phosphate transport system permease component